MKHLLIVFACALVLAGCAAQRAANDCEVMGYARGTPEFSQCAERQVAARRARFMEMRGQDTAISIQCEKSSQGIFGRNTGRSDCPHPLGMVK
ncbi:hypothetical protein [Trinickia sp. Y13]|uniref:hypothetical protein n=1 Tax=Trinickia sp. Y13 TaxID=2917807 RepID=UPI002405E06C|nr:hypothetical protein [Trinickia sp. Y13]MDG0024955.1 hypothetical protein [Trinickia sp. Y13]